MNFVKNQKDIKELLKSKDGNASSGLYIYSRDQVDKTFKIVLQQSNRQMGFA